eukprot:5194909-Pyramimonas_sp.AAC.1
MADRSDAVSVGIFSWRTNRSLASLAVASPSWLWNHPTVFGEVLVSSHLFGWFKTLSALEEDHERETLVQVRLRTGRMPVLSIITPLYWQPPPFFVTL